MLFKIYLGYILISRQSEEVKHEYDTYVEKLSITDNSIEELGRFLRGNQTLEQQNETEQICLEAVLENDEVQADCSPSGKESCGAKFVDKLLKKAERGDFKSNSDLNDTQQEDDFFEPVKEVKYVEQGDSLCFNHSSKFREGHRCNIYKKEDIIHKFEKDRVSIKLQVPKNEFLEYVYHKKYILCIVKLPHYQMKKLDVFTHIDESGNFIIVEIQSFKFFEYMLDSNSVMFFETKKRGDYERMSHYFYFRQIKETKPQSTKWYCTKKENSRFYDKNTFEQAEREPYRKESISIYDVIKRQCIIKHKYRGNFVVERKVQFIWHFFINSIPMLLCHSNLPLFKYYEMNFLKRYEDVPENIRNLVTFICNDMLSNRNETRASRINDLCLRLHNTLVNFGQNFEEYQKCELFSSFSKNKEMIKAYAEDERRRAEFLSYLFNITEKQDFTTTKFDDIFELLDKLCRKVFFPLLKFDTFFSNKTVVVLEEEIK